MVRMYFLGTVCWIVCISYVLTAGIVCISYALTPGLVFTDCEFLAPAAKPLSTLSISQPLVKE